MRCLNDVEIQHVADGEADAAVRAHLENCAACAARVQERERVMARLTAAASPAETPSPALAERVRHAVQTPPPARGATVLRLPGSPGRRPV